MTITSPAIQVGNDRIIVTYRLNCGITEAMKRADEISVEQSIEFPKSLVDDGDIRTKIIGKIEECSPIDDENTQVIISYAWELSANDLLQLLNVIYGNISIQPGIKISDIQLPAIASKFMPGPKYGIDGIRKIHNVYNRPLLATALKPMGLGAKDLAKMAYDLAIGGIDVIKDDHGLADQKFAPFKERVKFCAEAVLKANEKTGLHCAYYPNITARLSQFVDNATFAQENGAGGFLISPGLMGWDALYWLRHNGCDLPAMSHPTYQGTYVIDPRIGFSHAVQYGKLMRLAGYDMSVFPYQGGRFSFSHEDCRNILNGCLQPFGSYANIFPAPGGGMKLERIEEIIQFFGLDCVLLIGGDLHRSGNLTTSMELFHKAASATAERISRGW
ncbi:MAG: RuBisCO large subunit C-terminal-like domain-containing protein [Anaerolineaceae bacterium]